MSDPSYVLRGLALFPLGNAIPLYALGGSASVVFVPGNSYLATKTIPFGGPTTGGSQWAIKSRGFTRNESDPLTSFDATKWTQTTSGSSSIGYGTQGVTFTSGVPANDFAYVSSVAAWTAGEWQVSFQCQSDLNFVPAGTSTTVGVYAARIQWIISSTEYMDIYQTVDANLGRILVVNMVRSDKIADVAVIKGPLDVYTVKVRRWADKIQIFVNTVLVMFAQGWSKAGATIRLGIGTVSPAIINTTFYNFQTFNTVLFGDVPAEDVTFINDNYIRGSAPANSSGDVDVATIAPGGATTTIPGVFEYIETSALEIPSNASPRLSVVDDATLI